MVRLVAPLMLAASLQAVGAEAVAPRPPCADAPPIPAYGTATQPEIQSWSKLEWTAPACLAWPDSRYRFVIAIAGRVAAGSAGAMLSRFGAVSASRGVVYWSVTESAWRELIEDASALASASGPRRGDFTLSELRPGATLHFVEQDNRSGAPVTYAMHVVESGSGRIVVETENVTPIKALLTTPFPPGTMRTVDHDRPTG